MGVAYSTTLQILVRDGRNWAHNSETNNNDHSSREIRSKQWSFYQCLSELAHMMRCGDVVENPENICI